MIDTDKMKAAFAATPLCQHNWTQRGEGGGATKLCAISALVSFAGVQPELIHTMASTETQTILTATPQTGAAAVPRWVADLALPVLLAVYGIPREIGVMLPPIFDKQDNEYKGMLEVLALCEQRNMDEQYDAAITEDAARFPQHDPAASDHYYFDHNTWIAGNGLTFDWGNTFTITPAEPIPVTHLAEKPKGQTDKGKSKFWTAAKKPHVPKLLTV